MYIYLFLDSLFDIIMAAEKRQKIRCRLFNTLLYKQAEACMMSNFNIQRKIGRPVGCVACVVGCQMPVHQVGIFGLAFRGRVCQLKNTLRNKSENDNASQRIDLRFFKLSFHCVYEIEYGIFLYSIRLHQPPVELHTRYDTLYSYKNMVWIPKYSEDIVCEGYKVVIVDKHCRRIYIRGNQKVIVRKHCRRIYCGDNFFVICSKNCINTKLENNFIQIAV